MKRTFKTIAMLCIAAIGFHSISASTLDCCAPINDAIQSGEASAIEVFMAPIVDLSISNGSARCSRSEAAGLMAEFFRQNKPSKFDCAAHRSLVSGSLTTEQGKRYQVDYTLRTMGNKPVITGVYVY